MTSTSHIFRTIYRIFFSLSLDIWRIKKGCTKFLELMGNIQVNMNRLFTINQSETHWNRDERIRMGPHFHIGFGKKNLNMGICLFRSTKSNAQNAVNWMTKKGIRVHRNQFLFFSLSQNIQWRYIYIFIVQCWKLYQFFFHP